MGIVGNGNYYLGFMVEVPTRVILGLFGVILGLH